jgi:hypothetical protein
MCFYLRCRCRYEAIATADGSHLEVEAGEFGVATLVDQNDISLLAADDADQGIACCMGFAEVTAEATLSVVY